MLFADGEEVFVDRPESGVFNKRVRKGFKRKKVKAVLDKGGKLSFGEVLRCKVRYFSDGMVVGSRDFLDSIFREARGLFHEKRKSALFNEETSQGRVRVKLVGASRAMDDRTNGTSALRGELPRCRGCKDALE
jgi:hypothetical protein